MLAIVGSAGGVAAESVVLGDTLKTVLEKRCVECHNDKRSKGKLNIAALLRAPNGHRLG